MANRKTLGLSPEQAARPDEKVTEHLKAARRKRAEARALYVVLEQALRRMRVELQSAEPLLKKIGEIFLQYILVYKIIRKRQQ